MRRSPPGERAARVACATLAALALLSGAPDAGMAQKLRRPYPTTRTMGAGFDNRSGDGCRDYGCNTRCYDGHTGSDVPLPVGTDILAGAAGRVIAINNGCADYGSRGNTCGGRCGNYVHLEHADGTRTMYCHMKLNSLTVRVNQQVSCGQKLGLSASSGSSTGPHLHLSWRHQGVNKDPYRGECTSSPGAWVQQNGYWDAPGTQCACASSAEVCDGQDNDCDGQIDEGRVCELELLHEQPDAYAPSRTTDFDGDGLQDACARFAAGWGCERATGSGFEQGPRTTLMRDESGWTAPRYYSTIRMGDVDGDGLADVCARHSRGLSCWRSTGESFEAYATLDAFADDQGWDKPSRYLTLRLADVDGDGRDDVCGRFASGWGCHLAQAGGFAAERLTGPAWSDADGWDDPIYYGTIRTGDVDGDGKEDVCARGRDGWRCARSTGRGFEPYGELVPLSDERGWHAMRFWSTLRLADVDGDGRMDLCARSSADLSCWPSTGQGFGPARSVAALSDAQGWDDRSNFATLRAADIDGDGRQELCARANARVYCWGLDDQGVTRSDGPEWSDALGWAAPSHHQPMFLTDVTGPDRRRDLCARAAAGLTCVSGQPDGLTGPRLSHAEFTQAGGWGDVKYYSTMRLGQGRCSPERCDGQDNDCDGQIDEGQPATMGVTKPQLAASILSAQAPERVAASELLPITLVLQNDGASAWQPNALWIEVLDAQGRPLSDALEPSPGQWPQGRAATIDQRVEPGQQVMVSLTLRAPQDAALLTQARLTLAGTAGPVACPAPWIGLTTQLAAPETPDVPKDPDAPEDPDSPGAPGEPGAPTSPERSAVTMTGDVGCGCGSPGSPNGPVGGLGALLFWVAALLAPRARRRGAAQGGAR